MASILEAQRADILNTIRQTAPGEWKVMVMDDTSRKLVYNVVKEDDILNANITHIEQIEQRRQMNPETDVLYLLSPQPHIIDCLMADFEHRRYRRAHLLWTAKLPPKLRERVDQARTRIARMQVMNIDYYPRQSHLVTFRDPWSFPILYHPDCNNLIRKHLSELAEKIVALCVTLGEYPHIRYYKPRNPLPSHEAHVLCSLLARQVQDELDMWAQYHQDFPPPSPRPRGALYIVDRSLDLMAPFLHEFTYEAMAFDLLPIKDGEKITYRTIVNEGQPDQENKDVEITEKDRLWTENRHKHMADTIEKLMADFQKFMADNPHFANKNAKNANSLNAIKDMMAGLPQFQSMKESYSLHMSMAQECMNEFAQHQLGELVTIEQQIATGVTEDGKKPPGLTENVVRLLDQAQVTSGSRVRLLALYLLYRDGLIPSDLHRLCLHAALEQQDEDLIRNLELLGARVSKQLKDKTPAPPPLFPRKPPSAKQDAQSQNFMIRYETNLKRMLEDHNSNTLDQTTFPYTKPHLSPDESDAASQVSSASLRSAKPTWAKSRSGASVETRQRVVVFVAGGATYSESRACYEVGERTNKEVFLVSSHMLTPDLWTRQLADLSADRRRIGLPADAPKPRAPGWIHEQERAPAPPPHGQPPGGMQAAAHASPAAANSSRRAGMVGGGAPPSLPPQPPASEMARLNLGGGGGENGANGSFGKLHRDHKEPDKKKKHHKLFGSSKKDK